jgi:hypothetical protein
MDSRPRKTTLETFNDELAILDRPIEGEVEYYDERPSQRRRWQGVSAVVIGFGVFAGAGALFFSHQDPETIIAAAQAAAAATAPTSPSPSPSIVEVPAVTAPAMPPAPPAAVAMEPATEAAKWRQPPPRKAWTKLRLRSASPATP